MFPLTFTEKMQKVIASYIPDNALNVAMQKRNLEKALRAEGFSRSEATKIVWIHFKK